MQNTDGCWCHGTGSSFNDILSHQFDWRTMVKPVILRHGRYHMKTRVPVRINRAVYSASHSKTLKNNYHHVAFFFIGGQRLQYTEVVTVSLDRLYQIKVSYHVSEATVYKTKEDFGRGGESKAVVARQLVNKKLLLTFMIFAISYWHF